MSNSIKIMLDAGHFGPNTNPSTVVPGYYESVFTWDFHLMLKSELEAYGFEVATTRADRDIDLAVYSRGLASEGYDLFVSIHSNACEDPDVNRSVVYRPYDGRNNTVTLATSLADAIKNIMDVNGSQVLTLVNDSGDEFYGVMRGARHAQCPRYFILEHSFHTNAYASNWLLNSSNLLQMARAEAYTIARYFNIGLIKGDINGDGIVSTADYTMLKLALRGDVTLDDMQTRAADLNFDGVISSADYVTLNAIIRGETDYPF